MLGRKLERALAFHCGSDVKRSDGGGERARCGYSTGWSDDVRGAAAVQKELTPFNISARGVLWTTVHMPGGTPEIDRAAYMSAGSRHVPEPAARREEPMDRSSGHGR